MTESSCSLAPAMSPKSTSPLLGYNNNVKYKGRVFHIQTEDSGVKYGHVITHLFMDGGRILKSVKTSYAEYVATDSRAEVVRDLMKQQHKAMAISLRDGKFDRLVEGGAEAASGSSILEASAPALAPAPSAAGSGGSTARKGGPAADSAPRILRALREEGALDPERLERASAATDGPPPPPTRNVPPQPLGAGTTAHGVPTLRAAGARTPGPGGAAVRVGAQSPSADRRPPAARPASTFGQARPQGHSIFGEDLMSDKSLDDVILSYLAAEVDPDKK